MSKWCLVMSVLVLCGCNYSVVMNVTHGQANDLVDETDTATPNISPNIDVPVSFVR